MIEIFKKYRFLSIILILLTLVSCESLKDSSLSRIYHNVTAHYNIYFNANEIFNEMVLETEESHVDDYNSILDVYQFGTVTSLKNNASSSDRIIKKCTKIFDKHKKCDWIDDSYFLIGKAYFYKADFYSAMETFQYVISKYKSTDIAYEAMLWMAYSKIQINKYSEAQAHVTLMNNNESFPKQLKKELSLTDAHINILINDYLSAIKSLEKAIPQERKKDYKTRYKFILAQLYQNIGDTIKSRDLYEDVIKRNPPYDMAFNSKIEIARSYDIRDEKTAKPIKSLLYKMLNDDKNIQYLDQIYFEIAIIDLKLGNVKEAEKNLKLCIEHSSGNKNQKAIAFLKLAEYYYELPDYPLAKAYYDSTGLFLDKNYPEYNEIVERNKLISLLVANHVTVQTEDSLLYLANLSDKSRDSIIDVAYNEEQRMKMEEEKKEREKRSREEQEMRFNRNQLRNRNMMPPGMQGGLKGSNEWYFYNDNSMKMGESEFEVRWGKRKLVDNWRISSKASESSTMPSEMDSNEVQAEEIVAELTDEDKKFLSEQLKNIPKVKRKYYADVPFTKSQKVAANKRITEALKKIGDIYHTELYDTANTIKTFEGLLKRYPDGKYSALSHYILYNIYDSKNIKKKAHKDSILAKYPDSDYAILINDPNYFKNQRQNQSVEIKALYQSAYKSFNENNCSKVIEIYNQSEKDYPRNYKSKELEYLKILCVGKSGAKDEFVKSLNSFINSTANKELTDHAQSVVDYLTAEEKPETGEGVAEIDSFLIKSPYSINIDIPHLFIFLFETRKVNTQKLKISFSDYNAEYHELEELQVSTFIFDEKRQILVVRQFDNSRKSTEYLKSLLSDDKFLIKIKNRHPEVSIISQENFNILLREQEYKEYKEFFKRYYKN